MMCDAFKQVFVELRGWRNGVYVRHEGPLELGSLSKLLAPRSHLLTVHASSFTPSPLGKGGMWIEHALDKCLREVRMEATASKPSFQLNIYIPHDLTILLKRNACLSNNANLLQLHVIHKSTTRIHS